MAEQHQAGLHWVDGVQGASVPADDRGLLYGDGVFRTLRVDAGQADDLVGQLAHLRQDAEQLKLPAIAPDLLEREVVAAARETGDGIVRITLTRGSGGHGYAPAGAAAVRRIVSGRPLTLAVQPEHLALLPPRVMQTASTAKHLNRLIQVLAAAGTPSWASSGLLQDAEGRLVCATQSNICAIDEADTVITPPGSDGAMAGRMRARLLSAASDAAVTIVERTLRAAELPALRGLFCAGSVRGLQWVHTVSDVAGTPIMQWADAPRALQQLQAAIEHPAH